jgi:ectoine hydroxylase-related dioxygenase (phytanoyl-CoA dioxygenase family)
VLSNAKIEHFRTEGWVAVERFWTVDEVAAMRAELERLKRAGKIANVATAGDGVTPATEAQNLQLVPLAPHSRLFSRMAFAPQAVEAVTDLIGAPALLHLDQVFLKPARNGAGTSWHQDNAYFRVADPFMGTAMWTAVHDATRENGTLKVIPRAFDVDLPHARDPESNHHVRCWPDETGAIDVEVPAGGAIFFCYGTPHGTGGNRTERERAGVALHYLRADQAFADGGYPAEFRRPVSEADGPLARIAERPGGPRSMPR